MHQLVVVPKTHIDYIWEKVKHFIDAGLQTSLGEINIDQIRLLVATGLMLLIVKKDQLSNEILGATIINFTQQANFRVATIVSLGSKSNTLTEEDNIQLKKIAKEHGATKIQAFCKKAQARLFKRKFKYEEAYTVLYQDIKD